MAEYGLLQEIQVQVRDTSLAVAASVSDTELLVDNAGDFSNEDADEGGLLSLNGALLEYTGVEWGIGDEDPDTILLAVPLAVAADVGDDVAAVIAGLIAEDWYAVVDHVGGDVMVGPLNTVERAAWPQGTYDPPVPVMFSEDLTRLEDAPGRPASAAIRINGWNTDFGIASADGATTVIALTYTPRPGTLHVRQNGVDLDPSEWDLVGSTLTIEPSADVIVRAGHRFTTQYDYDGAAAAVNPTPLDFVTEVLAIGAPALWAPLGEASGSVAEDISGNNRDGAYGGTKTLGQPKVAPGLPGTSTDFEGTAWAEWSAGAAWQRPASFTAMIWAKPNANTGAYLFCADDGGTIDTDRIWNLTGESPPSGRIYSGTTAVQGTAGEDLEVAEANCLLMTFDGTTVSLYKDGELVDTGTSPGAMNTSTLWPLTVGATANGQVGRWKHFDGMLQHAVLWPVAATADQANRVYRAGMGMP